MRIGTVSFADTAIPFSEPLTCLLSVCFDKLNRAATSDLLIWFLSDYFNSSSDDIRI